MAYLLDANIFIQARKLHYGFDFCPAFWDWLVQKNAEGKVFSIVNIKDELTTGDDELSAWADAQPDTFFLPIDETSLPKLAELAEWANQHYDTAAVNTFLQVADCYLVAYALAHGHTVVTHEVPANTSKKIKIPNVCIHHGIEPVSSYTMLRRERARFILPA